MFASLIIRLFQLVFSAGIVFFSHNKSAGTVFRLVFSAKRKQISKCNMSVFGSTTKVPSKRQNDWQNSVCILKIKEFKIRDLLPRLGGMVGFSLWNFSAV